MWDIENYRPVAGIPLQHAFASLQWSPNIQAPCLVTSTEKGETYIWDPDNWLQVMLIHFFSLQQQTDPIVTASRRDTRVQVTFDSTGCYFVIAAPRMYVFSLDSHLPLHWSQVDTFSNFRGDVTSCSVRRLLCKHTNNILSFRIVLPNSSFLQVTEC